MVTCKNILEYHFHFNMYIYIWPYDKCVLLAVFFIYLFIIIFFTLFSHNGTVLINVCFYPVGASTSLSGWKRCYRKNPPPDHSCSGCWEINYRWCIWNSTDCPVSYVQRQERNEESHVTVWMEFQRISLTGNHVEIS